MTASESLAAAAAAADNAAASSKSTTETDVAFVGLSTGVLVFLVALWSLFGHTLSARSRYLNESGTACLLGLLAGLALLAGSTRDTAGLVAELLSFNSASFFTYLLPPVIFYAGLSVEQRLFFSNLPSILSFGVLGTLVSFVLISAALYSLAGTTFGLGAQDCLALGAVFAATDSVAVLGLLDPRSAPQLFSLVFGEGIVNDATSVLLLGALARSAQQSREAEAGQGGGGGGDGDQSVFGLAWSLTGNFAYLLLTSTCLGVAAGAGVAALLRGRVASLGPHHEVALVGLLSYLAYLAAEVLGLSGILSLFCCGAAVSRFALRGGGAAAATGDGHDGHAGGAATEPPSPAHRVGAAVGNGVSPEPSTHGGMHGNTHSGGGGEVGLVRANGGLGHGSGDAPHWAYDVDPASSTASDASDARRRDLAAAAGGVLAGLARPARRLAARAFGGDGGVMTAEGAAATLNAFHSLSYICEGLIFVYLGMDCLDPVRWKASYAGEVLWLVGVLLLFLMAARAASVVPLSMLHNLYAPRHQRLSGRDMLVIWWSGLMRGAVSVALVYLNFDTMQGSTPTDSVGLARESWDAVGSEAPGTGGAAAPAAANATSTTAALRHHRPRSPPASSLGHIGHRLSLLAADAAAASGGGGPEGAASAAVAAALAEEEAESARQHATLIVSTLLVVVASVLVVSTLTKPLLQAALEADPRKPPLKVLREALFDPWVDATWRFKMAVDRSYRRLIVTTGGGAPPDGAAGGAGGGGGRPASALALITTHTHTVPLTSTGGACAGTGGGGGGSRPGDEALRRMAASAVAAASPGKGGAAVALPSVAAVTATGLGPDVGAGSRGPGANDASVSPTATAAPGADRERRERPRGQLQQRASPAGAATGAGGGGGGVALPPLSGAGPGPSPSAASLPSMGSSLTPAYESARGHGEGPRLRLASSAVAAAGRRGGLGIGRGDVSSGAEDGDSDSGVGGTVAGGRRHSGSTG